MLLKWLRFRLKGGYFFPKIVLIREKWSVKSVGGSACAGISSLWVQKALEGWKSDAEKKTRVWEGKPELVGTQRGKDSR